jgi:uncharacterized protein (UPF0262 family)
VFGRREDRVIELIHAQREESEKTHALQLQELREFNREILLRNEKVYTAVIAEMGKQGERIEEGTKELREGREQIRANTKAVLRMLDRMNGSGGGDG